MADRIVVMRAGNIEQVGTPLEIYDTPANSFVGSFIGSPAMNLIDGVVVDSGGAGLKDGEGMLWPLPEHASAHIGRSVQLGLRPEHVSLQAGGLPATIRSIEPTGSETHVQMQVGGKTIVAVLRDRPTIAIAEKVNIGFDRSHMQLFDLQTGLHLR